MTDEELIQAAVGENFAGAAVIATREIPTDPMFRPYCEENLCGKYGVNYACPPDCGSPEEMRARLLSKKRALVLQTVWQIDDLGDSKAIKEAKSSHNAATLRLISRLRENGCEGFPVGASGCALCEPCALIEKKPCRFPELQYSCMSAYCIFVRKLCEQCGLEYDPGEGLLAFFGMYVCD